jgi:hypothetical protein
VAELIGSLDVEERARAKDTGGKGVETSSANLVQRKKSNVSHNNKKKNKQQNATKPKQTASFKKKNKGAGCFVCGSIDHWASACPDHKFKQEKGPAQEKKTTNMVVSETVEGTSRYVNLLPTVLSVCHPLSGGLTLVLTFMCVLIFLCFLLVSAKGLEPC